MRPLSKAVKWAEEIKKAEDRRPCFAGIAYLYEPGATGVVTIAEVDRKGELQIHKEGRHMPAETALDFANWIQETFGEDADGKSAEV